MQQVKIFNFHLLIEIKDFHDFKAPACKSLLKSKILIGYSSKPLTLSSILTAGRKIFDFLNRPERAF